MQLERLAHRSTSPLTSEFLDSGILFTIGSISGFRSSIFRPKMATTTLTRNAVRRGLFHRSSLPSALNVVTKQSSNWQLSRQTTTSTSFPASRIFTVNSVSQMNALGVALGTACSQGGDVVLVYGDLGVGKTVLSQGFVRGRTGMPSLVAVSPTFTVVSTYTHHQMQRYVTSRMYFPERGLISPASLISLATLHCRCADVQCIGKGECRCLRHRRK